MLDFNNALETVLSQVNVLGTEEKSLFNCLGQVTAENIYSGYTLPMAATAMPDGYAVHSEDIASASRDEPVTLRIIGNVRAGIMSKRSLKPGTAMRIMTGSIMPKGADCVVRFEDTDEPTNKSGPNPANPSAVKIFVPGKPGTNIRPAGSTVNKGALIVPKGKVIGPAQISALTAIRQVRIKVVRRPVVAVIATGDELISLRKPLLAGKSYNCNGPALAALVSHYRGVPMALGTAKDTKSSLLFKFKKGLKADAIVTTGGVSMGDYDLVRLIIQEMGKVIFSRIKMGPGASFAFGKIKCLPESKREIPVFALSGPPIGCLNNFETLVRPALLKMMGFSTLAHPAIEAVAGASVAGKKPMSFIKWANLKRVDGHYAVEFYDSEKTSMLGEMAAANSLMIIPEGNEIRKGEKVEVLPLDWCRDNFTFLTE